MKDTILIKDPKIETALAKDGFIASELLGEVEISKLRELYQTHFSYAEKKTKYNLDSNADCPADLKLEISNRIHAIVKPSIDALFENYEFLPAIFFIKKPSEGPESSVTMHQDPTLLIDEGEKTHIKIWCPLHDVDETNGTLHFIKGSHLFVPPVSAVTIPPYFSKVDELLYKVKQAVPLKAREVVMFDNRTIHCSMPNHTPHTRITAIVSIVVPGRQFISLYRNPKANNSPIEVYYQDHDWFYHPRWGNSTEPPQTGKKAGILDYNLFSVSEDEFMSLVKNPRPYKSYRYHIIQERKSIYSKLRGLFAV